MAGSALGQVAGLPDVFTVGGTGGYTTFGAAYADCTGIVSPSYKTCEVWDYNLTHNTETMASSPWNFNGAEIPVHLRLGPGLLTVNGPLVVPRNSTIEGSGRATSTANTGTVIQATSSGTTPFGGVGYINIISGGTGCTPGSGRVTFASSPGSGAAANWSVNGAGALSFSMTNPGGGYGTNQSAAPSVSLAGSPCTPAPTLSAVLSGSVVIIGDTNQGITASDFGSRLVNVTVDCNEVANCTAIELQNAQEQSGPFFVNAVNYTSRCLWIHGMAKSVGTDNSSAFDVECNGSTSASPAIGMSPSTVPVEFDNTKSRGIIDATINPVNSNTPVVLVASPSSAVSCTGSNPYTAVVKSASTLAGTIPTTWNNPPPYSLSPYVTIQGLTSGTVWNNTWPISSIMPGMGGTFDITGSGSCPAASGAGPSAAATLEPSADIIVCSGTSCASGAEGTENNPTEVSLIQVHMEHAGTGVFATGSNTSVNIVAPTTTVGNNSMYSSVTIDSGASAPASVSINSLLVNGGLQYMVVDGITGVSLAAPGSGGALAHYVSGTNLLPQSLLGPTGLQPPVAVKTSSYSITANDNLTTFDNTGASGAITYTLPASPVPGMTYTFLQSQSTTAHKVTISPGTGITIQMSAATVCNATPASGATISSITQFSALTLQAINATTWRATSCGGTWTTP